MTPSGATSQTALKWEMRSIGTIMLTAMRLSGVAVIALLLVRSQWGSPMETLKALLAIGLIGGLIGLQIWGYVRAERRRQRLEAGLCVTCGHDLRATPHQCPACGTPGRAPITDPYVPLRDDWPAEPIGLRQPEPHEQKVRIFTGDEQLPDGLLVQQLQARGIACFLHRRKAAGFWYLEPAPWVMDLHVWSGDEARARQIIDSMVRPDGTPVVMQRPGS